MASGVGLVPEQAWENPDLAASPFGTDPAVASIGFADGKAVGSASPLTWSQATEVRLIQSIGAGRPVEQPVTVRQRYARGSVPLVPITITAPTDGTSVNTPTATLHGSTAPGATVDVQATAVDFGGGSTIVTTTAGPDGTFTVTVPTPLGSNAVTAAATTPDGRTGWARITIVSDFITGTTVLDVTDPDGDDNGPGTYGYPTDGQFHAGAFDIERFQVIDTGDQVLLRTRLRDLSPTFGSPLGAQLLDVYVHQPGAASTSTAAAFTSRNYTIDPASAWSERLEAQGFADTVFVNPTGDGIGAATTLASQPSRTITIVAPKAAFGAPGPGWSFTVVLHGQDGFSPDQARAFTALPEGFSFGVCRPGVSSPICAVNPATVPKAMDVLTPAGVAQATELDPSRGPVVVHGVPVG
jgi:glucoamylase